MKSNQLTARKVSTAKTVGYYCDGGGLYLQVSAFGTRSWVFRFISPSVIDPRTKRGKAREMGLGSFNTFSLSEARARARECRQLVASDIDPIDRRKGARTAARLERAKMVTFKQSAEAYVKEHGKRWKNDKHRAQWDSTLNTYVYPLIGQLPVAEIDTGLVLKVLRPIWDRTPETASRIRGRIESVLGWATAQGHRTGDNPARWRGHLENLLASAPPQKHH